MCPKQIFNEGEVVFKKKKTSAWEKSWTGEWDEPARAARFRSKGKRAINEVSLNE